MAYILPETRAVFNPTPYQEQVLASKADIKVLLNGRQSGKSTVLKALIYRDALELPNRLLLYVATSIKQAKDIMWQHLTTGPDPIFRRGEIIKINNSEHTFTLKNGTKVCITGSDNPDGILGKTADIIYLDEWQSHRNQKKVWETLYPMITARNGKITLAGTARGFDDLYKKCQFGLPKSITKKQNWRGWHIPTRLSGTPAGTPLAIARAKSEMSLEQFMQEMEASPTATTGRVYPDFDEENIRHNLSLSQIVNGEKTLPTLHVGMDFNISNMSAIVAIKVDGKLYIVEEILLQYNNANTQSMAKEIFQRYPDRNIIIYPDASGKHRDSGSANNSTNHSILKGPPYNWYLKMNKANPAIVDRVNVVNSVVCNANGDRRLFVDSRCKNVINTFTSQQYDKNGKPIKDTGYDHVGDAFGYCIYQLFNFTQSSFTVGKM